MTQIKCLTSLRFFAATMIVAFHSNESFPLWDNTKNPYPLAQGVSFFFVLSGFILTYVYPSLSGDRRTRDFYIARISRIWPAHFVTFLLFLCLIPPTGWVWRGEQAWQIGITNLLLLQAWIPSANYYFSFNSVSWSISTEAFFYLVFPFLIFRFQRSWWWKLLCTTTLLVITLGLTDFLKVPPYDPANLSVTTSHWFIYINPLARILEFVSGMMVASLFLRGRGLKIVTSMPVWLWTGFELLAVAATILLGRYGPSFFASLFQWPNHPAFALYAGSSGSFPAFGLLIGILSFERGILSRLLSANWLVLLGEISYTIYLVHQILLRWYLLHQNIFSSAPTSLLYVAYWLLVLGISFAIWRAIEKPSQRWIRSRFGSQRDAVPDTMSVPQGH